MGRSNLGGYMNNLTPEEKAILSKHKYIYEYYVNDKMEPHVERFPVIYINSEYVYFKRNTATKNLDKCYTNNVKDSYLDAIEKIAGKRFGISYSWEGCPGKDIKELAKSQRLKAAEIELVRAETVLKSKRQDVEWAEQKVKQAKEALQEAQNDI